MRYVEMTAITSHADTLAALAGMVLLVSREIAA